MVSRFGQNPDRPGVKGLVNDEVPMAEATAAEPFIAEVLGHVGSTPFRLGISEDPL